MAPCRSPRPRDAQKLLGLAEGVTIYSSPSSTQFVFSPLITSSRPPEVFPIMAIELMTSWPALALLITIFFGSSLVFQDYTSKSIRGTSTTASLGSWLKRTGDIEWWMQIALPMYALHQFEEYGLDLYGRHYAFHETMCTTLVRCLLPDRDVS